MAAPTVQLGRDFDVGPRGISGHYSGMMTRLRKTTPYAIFAIAAWVWVRSWPAGAGFLRFGPALTLALILKIALIGWTVWKCAPLLLVIRDWSKWRALEAAGAQTIVRNDHRVRVVHYNSSTGHFVLDNATQQNRLETARNVHFALRSRLGKDGLSLTLWLGSFVLVFLGLFLLPRLAGHDIPFLFQYLVVPMSPVGAILAVLFFWKVAPSLSELVWDLYELAVFEAGNQYIPGAKFLEPMIAEKTIDTVRSQQTHGTGTKAPPGEAARRMAE